MYGKAKALIKLGGECCTKYQISINPFTKYQETHDNIYNEIEGITTKLEVLEADLSERVRKNTISRSDKESKRSEISGMKKLNEIKVSELNRISKNWALFLDKIVKNGPEKKKTW